MKFAKPVWIGLGLISGAGKDTAAIYIMKALRAQGYTVAVRNFAAALKLSASGVFDCIGLREPSYYVDNYSEKDIPLDKTGHSPRWYWEAFGEKMREIDPDIWIKQIQQEAEGADVIIITDVRHPNELEFIRRKGGISYFVERGLTAKHPVDKYLKKCNFDKHIVNLTTLADLEETCFTVSREIISHGKKINAQR